MDTLLQLKLLLLDTRSLLVPESIRKLTINPQKHLKMLENLDLENPGL